jgi:hypothetical protein
MALFTLLLMAAWTLLVMRLFAIGVTLSDRTFLIYITLGALMALSASPLAEKFIIPYPLGDYGFGYTGAWFRVLVRNLTLLTPAITYLLMRRTYRLVSVADAFGLAFATGFGFELTGAVLASSIAADALRGMTLFPPWQFTWDANQRLPILGISGDFAIAGAAYSIGLVALILAAGMRFWREPRKAIVASCVALILVSSHEALWMNQIISSGQNVPHAGFAWFYDLVMYRGRLVPLITLAALVYFTLHELRWAAASKGEPPPAISRLVEECQSLVSALLKNGLLRYSGATESARRQRQLDVINAERTSARDDHPLFQSAQLLDIKLGQSAASHMTGAREPASSQLERWIVGIAWSALGLIVVVMPWLPQWLAAYLWKFPLVNISLVIFQLTILQAGLALTVLGWFVQGPYEAKANWDPEESFRFHGRNAIGYAAMGAALLVLFQIPLNNFYPPYSTLAFLNRAGFPQFDGAQVGGLMLLLALIAVGAGLKAAAAWRAEASAEEQRTAVVRKSIILANAMIFMWISVKIYMPMLAALQKAIGPTAFNVFGKFGNVVVALFTIVLFFAVSLAIGYGLRLVSQRVEEFLLRSPAREALETTSK